MKFVLGTFLAIVFISSAALAQRGPMPNNGDRPSPEERAEKRTEKMAEKLGLDDYQTAVLSDLNLATAQELQNIRNSELEREEKKEAAKSVKENYLVEMENLLTPEQFELFEELREKRKGKGKGKGKSGRS